MRVLLIAYDNDSYINYFPLGLAYVASAFRKAGHEVVIYPQDKYHYPDEHLTEFLNKQSFDIVGTGMCAGYYQFSQLENISLAVRKAKNPPIFIIGGLLVSPDPKYFLTVADYVFVGEVDHLIKGIKWEKDPEQAIWIGEAAQVDSLPWPSWELFDIDYYSLIRLPHTENKDRCFPVLSARGCPFRCTFCYRVYPGVRLRAIQDIVNEIHYLGLFYYHS